MSESKPSNAQPPVQAKGAKDKSLQQKKTQPAQKPKPDSSRAGNNQKNGNRNSGRAPLWLSLFSLATSIALGVAAFFFWNQQQQLRHEQNRVLSQVDTKMAGVDSTINQVKTGFDNLKSGEGKNRDVLKQKLDQLAETQRNQTSRIDSLNAVVGRSTQEWKLAETEYLLRLAIERVQLQRDPATATIALSNADEILRELADPRFTPVRDQIAREREALQAVPNIDRNGLASSLGALLDRLDTLPVRGSRYQVGEKEAIVNSETDAVALDWKSLQGWKEIPRVMWEALRELVTIREHDKPVKPLVQPDHEFFLRQNVRLQLEAARLALLKEDAVSYRQSLQTAQSWIQEYFDEENHAVMATTERLGELASVNIRPDLPDIAQVLDLLRQRISNARARDTESVQEQPAEATGLTQ